MDTWRLENSALKDFLVATDHLNTPRELIDWMSKAVVWRWDSEPYGVGLPTTAPDSNGLTVTCNLRFPGQVYDAETGLHYNYMRDYNPAIGRYVESDPLGLRAGVNTYGYVGGSPVSSTDSTGEAPDQWWRPCNSSQVEQCQQSCEAQGKEYESCAVRTMSWKGTKGPQSGTPSNGGLSCSCKDTNPPLSCKTPTWAKILGGVAAVTAVGACAVAEPCGVFAATAMGLGGAAAAAQ